MRILGTVLEPCLPHWAHLESLLGGPHMFQILARALETKKRTGWPDEACRLVGESYIYQSLLHGLWPQVSWRRVFREPKSPNLIKASDREGFLEKVGVSRRWVMSKSCQGWGGGWEMIPGKRSLRLSVIMCQWPNVGDAPHIWGPKIGSSSKEWHRARKKAQYLTGFAHMEV